MEDTALDEMSNILRQHELHIRTLQMLLEFMIVTQNKFYRGAAEGFELSEGEILLQIDKAVRSAGDAQLGDTVRASMSEIVTEFFHNIRSNLADRSSSVERNATPPGH